MAMSKRLHKDLEKLLNSVITYEDRSDLILNMENILANVKMSASVRKELERMLVFTKNLGHRLDLRWDLENLIEKGK